MSRQETLDKVKALCIEIVDTLKAYQPEDDYFIMTFSKMPQENNKPVISFWNSSFRHDVFDDGLEVMPIEAFFEYERKDE